MIRTRWAALGAVVAIAIGAGGANIVSGTEPADAVTFVPITPCRVMDTRPATQVGLRSAPLGPGDIHSVDVVGASGECTKVPANATAISMNMTAVGATERTFLTVWASDAERPNASSLNPEPGLPPGPNAVATALSADGEFSIFNRFGSVHVLADINGYYVDHHHDDRYYTEAEADARFLLPGQAAERPTTESRWAGCNGPSMTVPDADDNTFIINTSSVGYIGSSTNGTRIYCSLDLPDGASMSRMRALLRDTGPTGSGQGLSRCFVARMPLTGSSAGNEVLIPGSGAGTGSSGSPNPILVDDVFGTTIIDNSENLYFIKCDLFSGGSTSVTQLGIYAAQVGYAIPIVPGTG